jgi:hypothetical protein
MGYEVAAKPFNFREICGPFCLLQKATYNILNGKNEGRPDIGSNSVNFS